MNLDTLGRASAESVSQSASTGLDPVMMLARLESIHRRRAHTRILLSAVAAAALVTVGWIAVQPGASDAGPVVPTQRDRQIITPDLTMDPTPSPVPTDVHNGGVALMDAAGDVTSVESRLGGGQDRVLLSAAGVQGTIDNTSFSWSSDGTRLTYAAQTDHGTRLFDLNVRTGEQDLLYACPSSCIGRPSPDRRWLAVTSTVGRVSRLMLVELSTTTERVLYDTASADVDHPSWAPDGSALVFLESDGDTSRVLTVQVEGGDQPRVVAEGAGQYMPSWPEWSPKGDTIAFLQAQPPFLSHFVTLVPSGGGPGTVLFPVGERDMGSKEAIHKLFHERYQGLTCNYGDAGTPDSVAWSPDGTMVVVRSCKGTFVAAAAPDEPPTFIASKAYSNPGDPPDFGAAAWQPVR